MDDMQRLRSNTIASAYQRYERHPVDCEIDGEIFTGNYWIAGMILVVSTATGGASRQLANSEPEDLARILLINLCWPSAPPHLPLSGHLEKGAYRIFDAGLSRI